MTELNKHFPTSKRNKIKFDTTMKGSNGLCSPKWTYEVKSLLDLSSSLFPSLRDTTDAKPVIFSLFYIRLGYIKSIHFKAWGNILELSGADKRQRKRCIERLMRQWPILCCWHWMNHPISCTTFYCHLTKPHSFNSNLLGWLAPDFVLLTKVCPWSSSITWYEPGNPYCQRISTSLYYLRSDAFHTETTFFLQNNLSLWGGQPHRNTPMGGRKPTYLTSGNICINIHKSH